MVAPQGQGAPVIATGRRPRVDGDIPVPRTTALLPRTGLAVQPRAWDRGLHKGQLKQHVYPAAKVLLTASFLLSLPLGATAAHYATTVVDYVPGTGAAPGYDQATAVLGEPSRVTPGEFGGPVDPFSAPWQPGQILSLGAGGFLTVRFSELVPNSPAHPFGIDFLVFGNSGFLITNGDFTGGGITDGSLFSQAAGPTRVSVSLEGTTFYTLSQALAPTVDGWFPTDGAGDFSRPVDPSLTPTRFEGMTLDGIRNLYAGSGGGTGYDIAWARDPGGNPVDLPAIQYVRVDVLADKVELDAFSAVPEPRTMLVALVGMLTLVGHLRRATRPHPPTPTVSV